VARGTALPRRGGVSGWDAAFERDMARGELSQRRVIRHIHLARKIHDSPRVAEIAEKTGRNEKCELRNVRDKLFGDSAGKLLLVLNSLRPRRLCGE